MRGTQRVLAVLVLDLGVRGALGHEALADRLKLGQLLTRRRWILRSHPRPARGKTSPGDVLFFGKELESEVAEIGAAPRSPTVRCDQLHAVFGRRTLPRRHGREARAGIVRRACPARNRVSVACRESTPLCVKGLLLCVFERARSSLMTGPWMGVALGSGSAVTDLKSRPSGCRDSELGCGARGEKLVTLHPARLLSRKSRQSTSTVARDRRPVHRRTATRARDRGPLACRRRQVAVNDTITGVTDAVVSGLRCRRGAGPQ
jgi:hypothetical protein